MIRGLKVLQKHTVPFDLLFFAKHLHHAQTLGEILPDLPMVIDHLAKPEIKQQRTDNWLDHFKAAARLPNIYCKLSGMVTEAAWQRWQQTDFEPYLDVVFEAFGSRRIMYGSDWPVCSVAARYSGVVGILSTYTEKLSEEEKADIWGGTACRFYGLE